MVWDFAEANPLSGPSGNFWGAVDWIAEGARRSEHRGPLRRSSARDAAADWNGNPVMFATDPPYYDNVPYADLSDFFYIWLRASLGETVS